MSEKNTEIMIDEKELSVAETEAKEAKSVYVHEFETPFTYEGKTYDKLTFDWGSLTGKDSLAIETELQDLGKAVIVPEFSGDYLIRMAARACTEKISPDHLLGMRLADYNKIRGKARSFLLNLT